MRVRTSLAPPLIASNAPTLAAWRRSLSAHWGGGVDPPPRPATIKMLFNNGPHLKMNWLTPLLVVLAVVVSVGAKCLVPLSFARFGVLVLNLVGTVLLASAFEPHIPQHGDGGWWDSLKHAVKEFPKYGSPPAFDLVRFYVGLIFLLIGTVMSAVLL
jgi:hypothetical protein